MFIGRNQELQLLRELKAKKAAKIVVVYGRRRVGKSSLIKEFAKGFDHFLEFQGLAPLAKMNNEDQLNSFALQLSKQLKIPEFKFKSWYEALMYLAQHAPKNVLISLDEISWMASRDPKFASTLKVVWDTKFSRTPGLVLALCGSVSSWIEESILRGPDFVGRLSLSIFLKPLPLNDSVQFWGKYAQRISTAEKIRILSILGGIPKYLEEINPKETSSTNIQRLCFREEGILFNEFNHIFSEIFTRRSSTYKEILSSLIDKKLTSAQIAKKIKRSQNQDLSIYLHDLEISGFLIKEPSFDFKGRLGKLSRYRICDNYVRFFIKYIEPNTVKIKRGLYGKTLDSLLHWDQVMGYQFENLVLLELPRIIELLRIPIEQVVQAGSYVQSKTLKTKGCQIDLMILDKHQTIYLGEIKFRKKIDSSVISELKEKIKVLKVPKNFSIRPFLIYSGELGEVDKDFFDKVISADILIAP